MEGPRPLPAPGLAQLLPSPPCGPVWWINFPDWINPDGLIFTQVVAPALPSSPGSGAVPLPQPLLGVVVVVQEC